MKTKFLKILTLGLMALVISLISVSLTSAQTITTGDACSSTIIQNWVNVNDNINWNIPGQHPDCTPTPTPTETPTPTPDPCADDQCVTPTVTPTPTQTPPNVGGPGDGRSDNLGCGGHDCSNQAAASQGQVLGASTGPTKAVLGLSATSGNENSALVFAQLFTAFALSVTGFKFLKNNA